LFVLVRICHPHFKWSLCCERASAFAGNPEPISKPFCGWYAQHRFARLLRACQKQARRGRVNVAHHAFNHAPTESPSSRTLLDQRYHSFRCAASGSGRYFSPRLSSDSGAINFCNDVVDFASRSDDFESAYNVDNTLSHRGLRRPVQSFRAQTRDRRPAVSNSVFRLISINRHGRRNLLAISHFFFFFSERLGFELQLR